ncbi:hypothetical protein D3C85_1337270 [compost metagenome]
MAQTGEGGFRDQVAIGGAQLAVGTEVGGEHGIGRAVELHHREQHLFDLVELLQVNFHVY